MSIEFTYIYITIHKQTAPRNVYIYIYILFLFLDYDLSNVRSSQRNFSFHLAIYQCLRMKIARFVYHFLSFFSLFMCPISSGQLRGRRFKICDLHDMFKLLDMVKKKGSFTHPKGIGNGQSLIFYNVTFKLFLRHSIRKLPLR